MVELGGGRRLQRNSNPHLFSLTHRIPLINLFKKKNTPYIILISDINKIHTLRNQYVT